jgi:hypothetical protein
MGHTRIANTQVYLHPSVELLNIAGTQLDAFLRQKREVQDA